MRFRWAAVAAFVGAAAWGAPATAEPPESVRVQASVACPLSPVPPTDVQIESDGATTVRQRGRADPEPRKVLELRLTDAEMTELRARIVEARFFDEWGGGDGGTDQDEWNVTIVVGAREKRRPNIYGQSEFAPLERFLWRLIEQAQVEDEIRHGWAVGAAHRLRDPHARERLLRPDAIAAQLGPALVTCAVDAKKPNDAAEAASVLLDFMTADRFAAVVTTILAGLDGDRRDAVLSIWAFELAKPDRAALRAVFAPTALAESRAPWSDWEKRPTAHTDALRALLGLALRGRVPGALDVAEERIRAQSTERGALFVAGLVEIGVEAVPLALRLLDDEAPVVRAAGARLAQQLAGAAKASSGSVVLSDADRAALADRLGKDVVPALERRTAADGETLLVREACFRALDAWTGRDRYAEERARRTEASAKRAAEEAARAKIAQDAATRREQSRPPKGNLSIAGRLLGVGDTPLDGFTLVAYRNDGPPDDSRRCYGSAMTAADGSFRIEGLVDGEVLLAAMQSDAWVPLRLAPNSSAQDGVRAGAADLVLRFPGGMLRGRVVDEAGRPVARETVRAKMRNPSSHFDVSGFSPRASVLTEADGRFCMLQLLPGVYDIEIPMHPLLDGAAGIVAGPEKITIVLRAGASVVGRVVDECGEPIEQAGVFIVLSSERRTDTVTDHEGKFRIEVLDPDRRYTVFASIGGEARRFARLDDVAAGAADVLVRIDAGPSVVVRVDFRHRYARSGPYLRLARDGEGAPPQRDFNSDRAVLRAAPAGTWRVLAHVRDVDAHGDAVDAWIELGTVRTGDPGKTFVVPR